MIWSGVWDGLWFTCTAARPRPVPSAAIITARTSVAMISAAVSRVSRFRRRAAILSNLAPPPARVVVPQDDFESTQRSHRLKRRGGGTLERDRDPTGRGALLLEKRCCHRCRLVVVCALRHAT